MLRVGLTGNIASGKSAVAEAWQRLGAQVVDADALARAAIARGTSGHARAVAAFGRGILTEDGVVDRSALRAIVFRDAERRAELEAILHPEIERLRNEAERGIREAGGLIVVHMIPLLFELDMDDRFDELVLVEAPADVRRMRLVERRGITAEEADRMMAAQMPAEAKRARAGHVIRNDGTLADLETRAAEVWQKIVERANECA